MSSMVLFVLTCINFLYSLANTIINDIDSHNQTRSEKKCGDTEVTHIII